MANKKEEKIKKEGDEITTFLKSKKISGIFYIPDYGMGVYYKTPKERIVLVDEMRTELQKYEKERELLIEQDIYSKVNKSQTTKIPSYT